MQDVDLITVKEPNSPVSESYRTLRTNLQYSSFDKKVKTVFPTGGNIQTMDKALVPQNPVSPNKKLNIAIALFLGLMVSVGIVFLLEYLDNTIKTENDVEKYLHLPILGIIPKIGK